MLRRRVVEVPDGDNFCVDEPINGIAEIRIAGVDAPERKRGRMATGEPGSWITTKILRRLIYGKIVELNIIKRSYDRWLADVFLNGRNLADILKRTSGTTDKF